MSGKKTDGGKGRPPAHKTEQRRAIGDEREAVLLALLSYEKNQVFSSVLAKRTLDSCAHMSTAERAFIKRLLEGVIERKTELDARIEGLTGRSVNRLHPAVHQLLRMGIYQILYMDAVPDSAACNEAVRLAKRHAPSRLSGFVNGVLRSAVREEEKRRAEQAEQAAASGEIKAGAEHPGLQTGSEKITESTEHPGLQTGSEKITESTEHPGLQAGSGKITVSTEHRGLQAGSEKITESTGQPGLQAGSEKITESTEQPGLQAACGEIKAVSKGTASAEKDDADRLRSLELRFSVPGWLIRMWEQELGEEETEKLLEKQAEILPVSARFCGGPGEEEKERILAELRGAGAEVEAGRWLSDSFRLRRTSDLRRLPGFSDGLWTVQDESSMLAVEAAGLTGTETVYDVCAAPGGKSFLAADRLRTRCIQSGRDISEAGTVHSYDLTRRKTDRIREGAKRLHLPNIETAERDARVFFQESEESADVLFCDLPCSGLGVIGKKSDIKYHASPEGIEALQKLQREILTCAVRYLKPGGVLIYSTCTICRRENQENADWIESGLGLVPDDLSPWLPAGLPGICGNRIQLLPHVHGTDGFFIARFRKK